MATEIFKDSLFKGKVLLLTGGTSKMLYQVALDFMTLGGDVALVSRRKKELDQVALDLTSKTNQKALGYELNLKKHEDYERVVDSILTDFKRIDFLVNGAAGNFLAFAEDLSYNGFKTVMEIDTLATFYMSKLVYTKWMKQNGGSIVNISASLHYLGTLMQVHSSAAKAGVDAITRVLALEWAPHGVRVNGVSPGTIEGTEGFERLSNPSKGKNDKALALVQDLKTSIPIQRLGKRNDVSNTVLYLLTDLSSFMTGQTLNIDGGQLATVPNHLLHFPGFKNTWTKQRPKF